MKKRIFFIIFIIILLFLPSLVKGVKLSDETCERYCEETGVDSSGNHIFKYRTYLSTGKFEGTVAVSESLYNSSHWFLVISKNLGSYPYIYTPSTETLYMSKSNFYDSASMSKTLNVRAYFLNDSGWVYASNLPYLNESFIEPNSFIYCKNVSIHFAQPKNVTLTNTLQNRQENEKLICPKPSLLGSLAIRYDLNDFAGSTTIDLIKEQIRSLTSVKVYVYDLNNNKNLVFSDKNVLAYTDVQQNLSTGEYYIDLKFSDYLNFMQDGDGDYLVKLSLSLTSQKHLTSYGDNTDFDTTTLYTSVTYARYKYFANSKSDMLIFCDNEGNEMSGGGTSGGDNTGGDDKEEDKTAEAINNQTNAINNQTQKIEEQTDAIKENTETNKNIFQQIIELPRKVNKYVT